jgi:hypothetical protein
MRIATPFRLSAVGLLAVFAAACADTATAPDSFDSPAFAVGDVSNDNLTRSEVRVCKYGSDGNFSVTSPTGNIASIDIADGECKIVAEGAGPIKTATVTENLASGQSIDEIIIRHGVATSTATFPTTTNVTTLDQGETSADGYYGLEHGTVIEFYNTLTPPPPPGGEGCTPGYWKAPQHFDSYPAGYAPTDLFDTYFADAFPGMTLVEVAGQGGGGLNALGRHAVAALLNAASGGVAYDLTVQEVIDAFDAAYASGNYEAQKDIFEGLNEQGCPLN